MRSTSAACLSLLVVVFGLVFPARPSAQEVSVPVRVSAPPANAAAAGALQRIAPRGLADDSSPPRVARLSPLPDIAPAPSLAPAQVAAPTIGVPAAAPKIAEPAPRPVDLPPPVERAAAKPALRSSPGIERAFVPKRPGETSLGGALSNPDRFFDDSAERSSPDFVPEPGREGGRAASARTLGKTGAFKSARPAASRNVPAPEAPAKSGKAENVAFAAITLLLSFWFRSDLIRDALAFVASPLPMAVLAASLPAAEVGMVKAIETVYRAITGKPYQDAQKDDGPTQRIAKDADGAEARRSFILTGFVAPFWEEILFRGFLLNRLPSYFGLGFGAFGHGSAWAAVVLAAAAAAIFSAAHLTPKNFRKNKMMFLERFLHGSFLGAVYLLTGSLVLPMLMHMGNNLWELARLRRRARRDKLPE